MKDGATFGEPSLERSRAAKGKSWFQALGIVEELRSIDYPIPRIFVDVSGTTLGLVGLYGLVHVARNGCVDVAFRASGSSCMTASENPFLYLLAICGMGVAMGALLFVFFRADP
ncbi:hypothetical protein [Jiella avicenniae]|uniref:Uncharacterized protein n=1 Tax=Jiella avicenniae TaxID=2907202 RepID=A0A9X1P0D3_9HYPH|nr:hypothetical protein [Jiella avicenniae]MCE7027554.1 hypothetical protein [Jiella avicenniae]